MPDENIIYACGDNYNGQLGINNKSYIKLDLGDLLFDQNNFKKKIIQIAPGQDHTIMQADDNTLLAAGWNLYGELGLGNNTKYLTFQKINRLENLPPNPQFKQIICGRNSSYIITTKNKMYSTGSNTYGELGLGNTTH